MKAHLGRSWAPRHDIEDACPCPKAPCGLAEIDPFSVSVECPEHGPMAAKTIRQMHYSDECPAREARP